MHDYKANTGFGTVTKNVISQLRNHFKGEFHFTICAINYFGEPTHEENTVIYPAKLSDGKQDDFGRNFFLKTFLKKFPHR